MPRNKFVDQLNARKLQGIKPKRKTPPKWLFPKGEEMAYDKALYSLVREIKSLIKEYLLPEIPSMINEVTSKMPNDRNDDYLSRLNIIILNIKKYLIPKVNETIDKSNDIALGISKFNKSQFEKTNQSFFGIDIFINEPWLEDQLKLFSAQNSKLIKSLPEDELDRVASDIERSLQQGLNLKDITKTIQKSFGITHRRAKLIARDQTTKLNASLTQLRQEELGVEEYIWQTSGDERVRPTHRHNDGKTFRWDNPSKITGHPGNDVNCRCIARPVLNKLLNIG